MISTISAGGRRYPAAGDTISGDTAAKGKALGRRIGHVDQLCADMPHPQTSDCHCES